MSHSFRFDARTEAKHQRIKEPIRWLTPSLWSSLNVPPEDCARLYVVALEPQTLLHRVYPRFRGRGVPEAHLYHFERQFESAVDSAVADSTRTAAAMMAFTQDSSFAYQRQKTPVPHFTKSMMDKTARQPCSSFAPYRYRYGRR